MNRTNDPIVDHTTMQDEWDSLAAEHATAWRELISVRDTLAKSIRDALAAIQKGAPDQIEDAGALTRTTLAALRKVATTSQPADVIDATMAELLDTYWQRKAERREGIPTGFAKLDAALGGGLRPRRLMTILGAPGKGKTTIANQIAFHVADSGRPVLYVTLEDSPLDLLDKTIARIGNLDYTGVANVYDHLRPLIEATRTDLNARKNAPLLRYREVQGSFSLLEVQEWAEQHFTRYVPDNGGSGLLVVDYLQRAARGMMGSTQSELRLAVSALTDQLRDVARELDCTVLAVASQNRASYNGGSVLASGKESGDLEYGVDVLAGLVDVSEDKNARTAPLHQKPYELRIEKNRQGPTASIALDFMPTRQQFTEATK